MKTILCPQRTCLNGVVRETRGRARRRTRMNLFKEVDLQPLIVSFVFQGRCGSLEYICEALDGALMTGLHVNECGRGSLCQKH